MKAPPRTHPLWLAYLLHRLSGLALALFLPLHFWVLSLALRDAAALDSALRITDQPIVKIAEFALVFLLAVHCFGGLRVLALEWLPWPGSHKTLLAAALAVSVLISGTFLLQVFS